MKKPAYWVPIATDDDGSQMRQSDRSGRDHASNIHEEAEKTGRSTVGETWEDEAGMDDELWLNIKGVRQAEWGATQVTPKVTDPLQRRHLWRLCGNCIHRCSRNPDQSFSLSTLANWTRSTRSRETPPEKLNSDSPTIDRIRKLESELRKTKAVNLQSK